MTETQTWAEHVGNIAAIPNEEEAEKETIGEDWVLKTFPKLKRWII